MIYYNRSNVEGLIGFKYNNEVYYYMKNNQDDVLKGNLFAYCCNN